MRLTRRIKIQLMVFAVDRLIAGAIMFFGYMQVPTVFFGVGRYTVTVQLPQAGGLYPSGNVTYRGVEVGRVRDGASDRHRRRGGAVDGFGHPHPRRSHAEVHSVSAVGEQYVALVPRSGKGRR